MSSVHCKYVNMGEFVVSVFYTNDGDVVAVSFNKGGKRYSANFDTVEQVASAKVEASEVTKDNWLTHTIEVRLVPNDSNGSSI